MTGRDALEQIFHLGSADRLAGNCCGLFRLRRDARQRRAQAFDLLRALTTTAAIRSRSSASASPDELRFTCHAAAACQPVRILSYCGFDPLMGRPFALKSGRPCQPLEIALPTKNRSCR
jgi:hypothetical protein